MKEEKNKHLNPKDVTEVHRSCDEETMQMDLLSSSPSVVHYFDENGALHSGRFVRQIEQGERKGRIVVSDLHGHQFVPNKIRNVE